MPSCERTFPQNNSLSFLLFISPWFSRKKKLINPRALLPCMARETQTQSPELKPTGKFILRVLKSMYSAVLDEKCNVVRPIPCLEDYKINEDVVWCRMAGKPEMCICYELEVGKTYYFVSKSVTYKVLVTDKKTDIVEISLAPPPCMQRW